MENNLKQNQKQLSTWWRFLIIILLVLGVVLRFADLDRKVYWRDEAATSLRVSGYTWREFVDQAFDGHIIGVEDLQNYQRPNPEKSVFDTIKGLAVEEPQHPPLYYVMARFWAKGFGNSVTVMRALPALISLFVFPCLYWLCLELFESARVGWIAIALMAVSLVHVMYAQEARQFSLWTVTILLSSAALLRAMRLKSKISWGIYGITMTLGLYTIPLHSLVAIGHGIYVFVIEDFRLTKKFTDYLLASLLGLLAFLPWIVVLIVNIFSFQGSTAYQSENVALLNLIKTWISYMGYVFSTSSWQKLLVLILEGYAIYFVCYKSEKGVYCFILALITVTALALILPDLILGGTRSTVIRYFFPCYLGLQLSVAYLFASKITSLCVNLLQKKLWEIGLIVLLTIGILNCAIYVNSEAEWYKGDGDNVPISHLINQADHPLVISEVRIKGGNVSAANESIGSLLALSYLLQPQVRLQLVVSPNVPDIPQGFSNIFLYNISEKLRSEIEQDMNKKSVLANGTNGRLLSSSLYHSGKKLWKL